MSLLHSKTDACQLVAGWKFIYGDANFRAMYLMKYPEVIYTLHSSIHLPMWYDFIYDLYEIFFIPEVQWLKYVQVGPSLMPLLAKYMVHGIIYF